MRPGSPRPWPVGLAMFTTSTLPTYGDAWRRTGRSFNRWADRDPRRRHRGGRADPVALDPGRGVVLERRLPPVRGRQPRLVGGGRRDAAARPRVLPGSPA